MWWYKLDKKYVTLYFKLVIISILYIFPVILADRYYNDDLGRTLYGSIEWHKDGRPIGAVLFVLLCGGNTPIIDISPLPLILGVMLISYMLITYSKERLDFVSNDYLKLLVLLFIITHPLAISNLSYKFDCIIMLAALSIPFAVYSIPDFVEKKKLFLYSLLSGILIMSMYQPAVIICISLFMVDIFFYIMDERKQLMQDCFRIGGILSGSVFYMAFVAPIFVDSQGWRHKESQMIAGISFDSLKIFIMNIRKICNYIIDYMLGTSAYYLGALGMAMIFVWGGYWSFI